MFVPDRVVFFCFVFISLFLFFCSTYQYSVACSSEQLRPIRLERQGVDDLVPTRHGSERNAPWSGAVMSTDSIIQTLDNKNINGTWRWQIESVQRSAVQGHSNHHVELHEYCSEQTYAALQRIVAFFFFFQATTGTAGWGQEMQCMAQRVNKRAWRPLTIFTLFLSWTLSAQTTAARMVSTSFVSFWISSFLQT